eukprot:COSAG03_NODE_8720_length_776_cov_1.008863_1_plen_132_part_10
MLDHAVDCLLQEDSHTSQQRCQRVVHTIDLARSHSESLPFSLAAAALLAQRGGVHTGGRVGGVRAHRTIALRASTPYSYPPPPLRLFRAILQISGRSFVQMSTAILSVTYRISSELRSQATAGPVSTTVGDH